MRYKIAVAVILSCILAGVAVVSYVGVTGGFLSHGFTLTATGRAYDPANHRYVAVSLSLTGTIDGKMSRVLTFHVVGGDLQVHDYGTFPVLRTPGILVYKFHFAWLTIKMTSQQYGGQMVVWCLRGRTGSVQGNNLPVSFYSSWVKLPVAGNHHLLGLWLTGTITLS